jgi:hypothetical protein
MVDYGRHEHLLETVKNPNANQSEEKSALKIHLG